VTEVAVVVPSARGPQAAAACVQAVLAAAGGVRVDVVVVADGAGWPDPLPDVPGARLVRSRGRGPGPSTVPARHATPASRRPPRRWW
jgi:hypothetical protein